MLLVGARLLWIALVFFSGGCGGDSSSGGGGTPQGLLSVEIVGDPTVEYNPARGRTTAVVQFIARGDDGVPLSPDELVVEMEVDDGPVDNESVLQESSEALTASLFYALVLDASGSMLQHKPPAFGPVKQAARVSVEEGETIWTGRPGSFSWDLCWFNDTLFRMTGGWAPADVLSIPDPALDAATKLYAAVEFMAGEMLEARQTGTADGPRDHHVMVVLSDGADNLSGFDNAEITSTSSGTTSTGARYTRFGWQATTLDDALEAIRAHPNLTVHVLAMGSNFQQKDLANLQQLADAGGGQLLENPDSSQVDSLFQRVTKEFSTLQTLGASIPQQSGDHTFTLLVRGKNFSGQASQTFRYRAGPDAQLLP